MDNYQKIVISRWDGGLNNSQSPFDIGETEWYRGENMMLQGVGDTEVVVRPGIIKQNRTYISNGQGIYGLYRYYKSDGTAFWIVTALTGIYYYDADNVQYLPLTCDLTLNNNQRFKFKTYNDLLLMVNGSNHPMFWGGDITHNVHRLGIPAPTTAISTYVGNAGSGSLETSVDYFYKYSYYNSENGMESNLSTVNASAFQTTTGKITVTIPQNASLDGQVDKIRLYRSAGGGLATDTLKWTGVDFDATGLDAGDITCDDTVGDSGRSTDGDWTDRYQPGYGGGTDFKFIEICREITFLAGESTNPSRLYFSSIGYPERYGANDFYDVGKDDGDVITGLIEFGGNLVILKERSLWMLYNPYDPSAVNLIRLSNENGCIAEDFVFSDGNNLYFMDIDGGKIYNGATFARYTNAVAGYFGNYDHEDRLPLPVKRNMIGCVWNNKLLHCFSSEEVNSSNQVVRYTTEYTTDSGGEKKSALFDADSAESSFQSGTDAVIILDQTQSALNKEIEVTIYIPWDESQFRQTVEYSIYFSYDDGVSWKKMLTDSLKFQRAANKKGLVEDYFPGRIPGNTGFYDITPSRNNIYRFYDVGVTQIRLDLHGTYANGSWYHSDKGDADDTAKLNSIDLLAIAYYYEDTSTTALHDRVLAYNIDTGKWDTVWKGYKFKPNCFALGDKQNDLYELYFGDSELPQVYQFGVGDRDDGDEIWGWFQTKHYGARDGLPRFFDRVFLKLLNEVGSFQLVIFVDNVEKLRRTINTERSASYFGSALFKVSAFGGNKAIIDRIISLIKEGQYFTVQIIRKREVEMPLLQLEIEVKGLEY